MAYISSDSSNDDDYVNLPMPTNYRPNDYPRRVSDKEKDREMAQNKMDFEEERVRHKSDLTRDDSFRRVKSSDKRSPNYDMIREKFRRAYKIDRERDEPDLNEIRGQQLKDLIEREINQRFEDLLNSQREKKEPTKKSNKIESMSEDELIEQKVQARLAEIEEKRRKEEEKEKLLQEIAKNKTDLLEMEKRMANMLQQGLQQQKQQFEREKEALIEQTKQIATLKDQRSNSQKLSNKQNITNDFNDPPSYSSLKQKSERVEVDFGRASGGEYQILLLGGTGTGKSTLINTMANYFLGGSLEHPKVVIPTKYFKNTESGYSSRHSEAASDDVTKSQTTKCLTYTFMHPKNRSLKFVFIDSPGLSDTKGTEQDDANLNEIINSAITAGALSAIIVIANGTESRVTPSIMNTLVRLGNNLPDELIDRNLILVLTKCSRISATFDEEFFAKEIARPKDVFYMDNQAFCSDPKTWQLDEDAYEGLILKWKQSHRTFDNLLKTITGMSNTSTSSFQSMKDLRNKLKSEIATICQDIANIQKVQDSLEAAQIAAQKTGDKKDSFANYTKEETITLKKIVSADYHSTVCTTHFIQDTICHQGCGLEFTSSSGTNALNYCACIGSNGNCDVCGCGPQSHYHAMVALETVTETIEKVLEDMKAQYDSAFADYQKFSADSDTFQSTLDNLQAEVDQKYLKIHQLCYDLSKICSRFNFVDELHANIENMKLEARMIKNADIRKNAENEIAKLIKLANDLSANQSSKGSYSSSMGSYTPSMGSSSPYKGSYSHSSLRNAPNMNSHSPDTSQNLSQNLSNAFKSFKKSLNF